MSTGYWNINTHSSYYNNSANHGSYQYQTLDELISTFVAFYVGENKIIPKASKEDITFFGRRAMQELSYDTLRSKKTWEFELDNRMYIPLPHDFIGYTKVFWVDSSGIKRPIYPTRDTQNPFRPKPKLDDNAVESKAREDATSIGAEPHSGLDDWWETSYQSGEPVVQMVDNLEDPIYDDKNRIIGYNQIEVVTYPSVNTGIVADNTDDDALPHPSGNNLDSEGNPITETTPTTLSNFANSTSSESEIYDLDYNDGYESIAVGQRYGLSPEHAQINGSYFMDYANGRIYFGPSLINKTIVIDYLTDGLGEGGDMVIHKFAEEAFYKHVAYAIASTGSNYSPATIQMLKKERFAETRKAKLRLSNIKPLELVQVLRGKSKWIKH